MASADFCERCTALTSADELYLVVHQGVKQPSGAFKRCPAAGVIQYCCGKCYKEITGNDVSKCHMCSSPTDRNCAKCKKPFCWKHRLLIVPTRCQGC